MIVFSTSFLLQVSIWSYFLLVIWPATSLVLMRSYHEHKPESNNIRSTVIVESNPVIGLLFLNNNLHVIHHEYPALPLYQIP